MDKVYKVLFGIILASAYVSALAGPNMNIEPVWNNTKIVLEVKQAVHIGDDNITHWEDRITKGLGYQWSFHTEGPVKRAWIDTKTWDVDLPYNPLKINNHTFATFKANHYERWYVDNFTIPRHMILKGWNNLSIHTGYSIWAASYDDLQINDLKLYVEYYQLEPRLVSIKTFTPKHPLVHEIVNVSVIITNLGVRPAFNISVKDLIPKGSEIAWGNPHRFFSPMKGGDKLRIEYGLKLSDFGELSSNNGTLEYYTGNWSRVYVDIEPLKTYVHQKNPQIIVTKSVGMEQFIGVPFEVEITLKNNDTDNANKILVANEIRKEYNISLEQINMTLDILKPNESVTFKYNVTALNKTFDLVAVEVYYENDEGLKFIATSNHVDYKPVETPFSDIRQTYLVAGIAITIILLIIVYIKVK